QGPRRRLGRPGTHSAVPEPPHRPVGRARLQPRRPLRGRTPAGSASYRGELAKRERTRKAEGGLSAPALERRAPGGTAHVCHPRPPRPGAGAGRPGNEANSAWRIANGDLPYALFANPSPADRENAAPLDPRPRRSRYRDRTGAHGPDTIRRRSRRPAG